MNTALSLPAIFGAGALTFASPCILPLVPVYLALLAGSSVDAIKRGDGRRRLVVQTLAFALGLALVFVALGLAASQAGRALAAHRVALARVAGVAVALAGLRYVGVLRAPWLEREFRPALHRVARPAGFLGAMLFGAAFALGWTPCIGPVLGAVLTFAASRATSPLVGALYLATYAAGLALPLVLTSVFAPSLLGRLRAVQRRVRAMEVATGVAMVGLGVLLATQRLDVLVPRAATGAPPAVASRPAAACDAPGATACGMPSATATDTGGAAEVPERGPYVLEFASAGCTVCARMAPVVERVSRGCGRAVPLVRVDVASGAGARLASRYGVAGVPTFVAVGASGDEEARAIGEQSEESLRALSEGLVEHACAAPGAPVAPPDPRAPAPAASTSSRSSAWSPGHARAARTAAVQDATPGEDRALSPSGALVPHARTADRAAIGLQSCRREASRTRTRALATPRAPA